MSPRTDPTEPDHAVDIQWGVPKPGSVPDDATLGAWVVATLSRLSIPPSVTSIRMMSIKEIAALNSQYRDKAGPTNVLSFPAGELEDEERRVLGDIAVCVEVVEEEARELGKAADLGFGDPYDGR
jgi:probable rRNA maturation factor